MSKSRNHLVLLTFAVCLLGFYISCEKNKTPLSLTPAQLTLSAEYVAVTEAWLQVRTENIGGEQQLKIWRDTTVLFNGILTTANTTVYDSTLLPAHDYTYHAAIIKNGDALVESPPLKITTMDTTSHDFNWQIYTIASPYGSGVLRDVAIINENDIWAVGEIYADSAQPWLPYNAVHWDGQQWELKRIPYVYNGQPFYHPMNFAFSFENGEVWFGGNGIVKWNGNNFSNVEIDQNAWGPVAINKMWGSSPDNVFIVGNEGSIAHYGGSWQKIESGSGLGLLDIWGISNDEIYIVGVNRADVRGVVLKYDGIACQTMIEGFVEGNGFDPSQLFKTQLYGATEGLWVDEDGTLYTVGNLMYQYKRGKWDYVRSLQENFIGGDPGNTYRGYLHTVNGNASNDIFIFGQSETLIHFNGSTWQKVGPAYVPWSFRWWLNCEVNEGVVVAVGRDENGPRIIKLWR